MVKGPTNEQLMFSEWVGVTLYSWQYFLELFFKFIPRPFLCFLFWWFRMLYTRPGAECPMFLEQKSWDRVSNAFGAEELGHRFQCFCSREWEVSRAFATTSFHSFNRNWKIRLVFFVNVPVLPYFLFLVAVYKYLYDIFIEHVNCKIFMLIESVLVLFIHLC